MEIVTTETKVYTISELALDSPIRTAILEKQRDINIDYSDWSEPIKEDWKSILEILGFFNVEIMNSGFCSQGDGSCFTANFQYEKGAMKNLKEYAPLATDIHEIAQEIVDLQKRYFYGLNGAITHSHRYYHEYSTNVEVLTRTDDWATSDVQSDFGCMVVSLNKLIHKKLETYFWELQEDEMVVETIEANEYRFTEDGNIF